MTVRRLSVKRPFYIDRNCERLLPIAIAMLCVSVCVSVVATYSGNHCWLLAFSDLPVLQQRFRTLDNKFNFFPVHGNPRSVAMRRVVVTLSYNTLPPVEEGNRGV
jgi:hypothetical protein